VVKKFRYIDDLIKPEAGQCVYPGCDKPGEHRAPVSPDRPGEYQYFCLEHVKEFNKKWDYFKGKDSDEILDFQKSAFTGHRPTWKMHPEPGKSTEKLQAALHRFRYGSEMPKVEYAPPLNVKDRRALEQLDLEHPCDEKIIKKRYKKLARKYHPDRNQGDRSAEERFKEINASYRHLIEHYCASISNS
jgi:DnaJ-class molecular chaperone with C-terminal Zn finger domain